MTPERQLIAMAVIEGKLPESALTQDEVDEVVLAVEELLMIKKMDQLAEQGRSVFYGCEEETVH